MDLLEVFGPVWFVVVLIVHVKRRLDAAAELLDRVDAALIEGCPEVVNGPLPSPLPRARVVRHRIPQHDRPLATLARP